LNLFSGGGSYAEDMGPSARNALLVAGVLFAGFLCVVVAAAPTAVGLALAVAFATGWCAWLDRHPEAPTDRCGRTPAQTTGLDTPLILSIRRTSQPESRGRSR
jgi:uncharacterized iron-regulated membrane protein